MVLNSHVEKLEVSFPWLILGANTGQYGRKIREGSCGAKMDMNKLLKAQPVRVNQDFINLAPNLPIYPGEMASCEVEVRKT